MKTPIQELIEEMQKSPIMYSSGLLAIDILKIKQKEKEFVKQCFEAGRTYQSDEIKYSLTTINHNEPNFYDYYKQFEK